MNRLTKRYLLAQPILSDAGSNRGSKPSIRMAAIALTIACVAVFQAQAEPETKTGGEEYMDRPSARPLPEPKFKPQGPPKGFELPPVPEAAPGQGGDGRKFKIARIVLSGVTAIPIEELQKLTKAYEGREASAEELEELRKALTRHYIERGYINSGAIIPAQALKNGELRIDIVEGRLEEVRVKGQGRLREGYIRDRLQGDPERPFNLQELQDRFQSLLSDPLISRMNGRILPGAAPGAGVLEVDVTRARPYRLSLFGNNYRPPSIGAEAFGINAGLSDLTGLGDALDFTFITSSGSNRYAGGFVLPLTDLGTQAFFHFDEGDSVVVEERLIRIDIKSQVHNLEGGISHPLIDELRQRLNVGLMLAVRENETSLLSRPFSFIPGEPTGRSQATVARLFQDYTRRWERHALALRSSFSVGLNALGATPETRERRIARYQDSEFFAWLGQAQYVYRALDNGGQLVLRGAAQFSDEPLLPLERIAVGGANTVRGYRENYLVRDEGYTLTAEFHYPLLGGVDSKARHRLVLIPFFDYGAAWNHRAAYNRGEGRASIMAVGIGFNWRFDPLTAEFYYGHALRTPLAKTFGDLQDSGLHFQVRMDVF
jgi:hemolysin activation/secretion protein